MFLGCFFLSLFWLKSLPSSLSREVQDVCAMVLRKSNLVPRLCIGPGTASHRGMAVRFADHRAHRHPLSRTNENLGTSTTKQRDPAAAAAVVGFSSKTPVKLLCGGHKIYQHYRPGGEGVGGAGVEKTAKHFRLLHVHLVKSAPDVLQQKRSEEH